MKAINTCSQCGSQWQDECHPAVRVQEDDYGNVWELSGWFWLRGKECPHCHSPYFHRGER